MQKFLILLKFAAPGDFCGFYHEMLQGRVRVPTKRPLPEGSRILFQVWIPEVAKSFLIPGKSVLHTGQTPGMTVDIAMALPHFRPIMDRALAAAGVAAYQEIASTQTLPGESEAFSDMDPLISLEMESSQPPSDRPAQATSIPAPSSEPEFKLADDDFVRLEMETPAKDAQAGPDFQGDVSEIPLPAVDELEFQIAPDEDEKPLFKVPPSSNRKPATPPGMGFEAIKQLVEQAECEQALEPAPAFQDRKNPEKKELTPEERALAEPVGKFFMNFTKAMLRSGYYDPGHPGAQSAKHGLYEEFIAVLAGRHEIMLTIQSSREGEDIMLTGILDEPVGVRMLVGSGVAELFAPKLAQHCEKKKLVSFAMKRSITPTHFDEFINIMSDPSADAQGEGKAGALLTGALLKKGITEISTIFASDMVDLETSLPWRVEMAIHRMAKDLKVLPMFHGVSQDKVRKLKLQAVQDIIRPLKHPQYLNDFLVNCYLIARYVDTMKQEEIEEMVVAAFAGHLLLPTARFTCEELERLKQLHADQPANKQLARRIAGIRRVLKLIAYRVVAEKLSGGRHFLHLLHENEILRFEELPKEVQQYINDRKMAVEVHEHLDHYLKAVGDITGVSDAVVYLQCFRRSMPGLLESGRWETIGRIAETLAPLSRKPPFSTDALQAGLVIHRKDGAENFSASPLFRSLDAGERALVFVFKDIHKDIVDAFVQGDNQQRRHVERVMDTLGTFGAHLLSRILVESPDREVRKLTFEALATKGRPARQWAKSMLSDEKQPWFVHRNAMMILSRVSQDPGDFDVARMFLAHDHPKLREEVLNLVGALKPRDAETIIIEALDDKEPKVRWRAARVLSQLPGISKSGVSALLALLSLPCPREKDQAEQHLGKLTGILTALAAMPSLPDKRNVEASVIGMLQSLGGEKKSLWKKVKGVLNSDQESLVLKAAIPLLAKVGGNASRTFLKQLAKSRPDLLETIKKAVMRIKD